MQKAALNMPEAMGAAVHFAAKEPGQEAYWSSEAAQQNAAEAKNELYHLRQNEWSTFNATGGCTACAPLLQEWEYCYNELYHALEEFGLTDPDNWQEEEVWYGEEYEATGDDYEAWYGEEYEGYWEEGEQDEEIWYEDDTTEENAQDILEVYTLGASDCESADDEAECAIYLQQRKA